MKGVMDFISQETGGISYHTVKYSYDTIGMPALDYDNDKIMQWEKLAETHLPNSKYIDLSAELEYIKGQKPLITYFLDGSRHIYKVDDISYNSQLYPVIAGQIGVGCCKRVNGRMTKELFDRRLVLVLPSVANAGGWNDKAFFAAKTKLLNENEILKRLNISFSDILIYKKSADQFRGGLENAGQEVVQDYMLELEKATVAKLVEKGRLNDSNYLLKDGSLEYRINANSKDDPWNIQKIKSNYRWVIGVSKLFNPSSIKDNNGKSNSNYIANLPLFNRTQVALFKHDGVSFGVWYIRLRDKKYTNTPFDGVIKVEQIIIDDDTNKLDTETVDMLSAHLITERVPTCYGSDTRWANHLYPVYLTESFVKSQYMSTEAFLQLF